MKELNIPVYRAEVDIDIENTYESTLSLLTKIENKYYAIGFLFDNNKINIKEHIGCTQMGAIQLAENRDWFKIKPLTLAIHFYGMLDSHGNRIFASLSEDGKGGDNFLFVNSIFITWFDVESLTVKAKDKKTCEDSFCEWYDFKNKYYGIEPIGIQQ